MTCTYTGAQVFFQDYGFTAPADLYEVGDCIVIRWNIQGKMYVNPTNENSCTHEVWLLHAWHREDIGVSVIKKDQLLGPIYR